MGLNVKAAMSVSLVFIVGVTWLVTGVARPIVELPATLLVRAPTSELGVLGGGDVEQLPGEPSGPVEIAERFERPSSLKALPPAERDSQDALFLAAASEPLVGRERVVLPPLHTPLEIPGIADASRPGDLPALAFAEDVPVEAAADAAAVPVVADPSGRKPYRVRRGDTLTRIARRVWKSKDPKLVQLLLNANPQLQGRADRIFAGEELIIPGLGSGSSAGRVTLVSGAEDERVAGGSAGARKAHWYTIRKHDSLASIARRHLKDHRRWREIAKLNGLKNADRILPGTRIKLPAAGENSAT